MALIKAQSRENIPKSDKEKIEETYNYSENNSGLFNSHVVEPTQKYNMAESETVLPKARPTRGPSHYIILGRDRPRGVDSGYGGAGHTHCASIDLVAGLSGMMARDVDDEGQQVFADKSPELDAARIYISQRTDVDANFNLPDGSVGSSTAKSAVAVKADAVRLIARDGIKLVTGTDTYDSQGVRIDIQAGIDLISGNNDEDLQPLVKGTNLEEALQDIIELVADLNGIVVSLVNQYFQLVTALTLHTHIAAAPGAPVTPSPDFAASAVSQYSQLIKLIVDLSIHQKNTVSTKMDFTLPTGAGYINSIFNRTN
jgi:hypothetical protein